MTNEEMLLAMEELLDRKLEEKLEEKLDKKLDEKLEEKLDKKFDEKLKPIYDRLDRVDDRLDTIEDRLDTGEGRLDRLEADMKYIKVVQLENNVIPRLNTIEACYLDTSQKFMERTEQIGALSSDIVVLKQVVTEHSQKLNKILDKIPV
ncbi:MAG: hypothetical protein NC392_06415 [Roseburia sp.]|nr:hypothetical protein [Roseburia sp.]